MLSVAEALDRVLEHAAARPASEVALSDALGLVLAEDIVSDIDSPPHDKSMVDGYAIRGADLKDGKAKLTVLEEITAGAVPSKSIVASMCSRIMTGAPIPGGADSVMMIEQTKLADHVVEISDPRFRAGQNIMRRGKSLRRGDVVLRHGAELGPAEIGLLAEVGRARIQAIGPVSVAILSTGNELVPAAATPGPGQIRNSNGPLLNASVRNANAKPIDLGIARDDVADLRRAISTGLESEVLIISGGVSAGVLDLVPKVLAELGVEQVFHKVNLKPGKPLWFGVHRASFPIPHSPLPNSSVVFGLPGNPISTLVCFELFVKPAIARIAGRKWEPPHPTQPAMLTSEFTHRGDRPTYHPAIVSFTPIGAVVEPTHWQGSADLRGFVGANAMIAFPAGDRSYQAGETVSILLL
jgi:molybdopterin molybdotransferase